MSCLVTSTHVLLKPSQLVLARTASLVSASSARPHPRHCRRIRSHTGQQRWTLYGSRSSFASSEYPLLPSIALGRAADIRHSTGARMTLALRIDTCANLAARATRTAVHTESPALAGTSSESIDPSYTPLATALDPLTHVRAAQTLLRGDDTTQPRRVLHRMGAR